MKEIKVIQKNSVKYANTRLKRVAAYARVSTKLEMQASSIDLQIKHYAKEIIFNPSYIFAGIYADHGKSGRSMEKRNGFQDLLKKIKAGHIDLVLVKSLSRFARNTVDSLRVIQETRKLGVEFYFEKEGISSLDTTVDMILSMMSGMAEQESQSMGQNISWGFQKRAQKGQVTLHKVIGYEITEDKKYKIIPKDAKTIQELFSMKRSGDKPSDMIEYARSRALKTTTGNLITTPQQIQAILKDKRYIGIVEFGKTYTEYKESNRKNTINDGDKPKYIIRNHHESIIDIEIFNEVQSMVKEHKTTYDISNRQEHILKHFFYDLESGQYIYRGPRKDKELVENMLDPKYLNNPHFPKHITKIAIHVLKRSLNALGRNFSDLEAKFDKQVNQLLNKDKIDKKLKDMAYIIKTYKDKYFVLKKKDKRDAAELAMLKDLEDEIIKFSIEYIKVEDQKIEYDQILKHAERLKENIKSFRYPLESITPEVLISIVSNIVKIDDENYALLINATSLEGGPEAIKKAIANKPLVQSKCISNNIEIDWSVIMV